ncbi:hypothetical protein VP1G_08049 [Cytospora mali]|uniref:Rhodopsin domain-containing protein n=1 Tax=Cytospora mali TaxID=578113 RepID=A0A194VA50_CYTMA|nr:hypothetical protein VP1G_08049 [Valsa mali var. pyri (nom. inval.)]
MPDDVRAYLVANCIVHLIVILVVAGRIVSRRLRRVKLSWDDYLIIVAIPQALTLVILQGLTSTLGSGYHLSSAIMPNLEFILKLNFAFEFIYLAALGTIKMSILSFYLRLFSRGTRMNQLTQFAMFVVGLWVCMHAEAVFMVCQPIQLNWDVTAEGVCGDQIKLFESIIITNIIVDALIWSMPLYTVWHLRVRKSDKVGLTSKNSVIIAAIARVICVASVDIVGDITGTMALTVFLAAFEPGLAITCACIPMLRPLWAEFRGYVSTMRHSTDLTADEDPSKARHGNELNNMSSSFGLRSISKAVGTSNEEDERHLRTSSTGGNLCQTSPSVGGSALDDGRERGLAVGMGFGVTAPLDAVCTPGRGTKAGAADYEDASLESGSEWDLMPGLRAPPARSRLNSKSKWTISRG